MAMYKNTITQLHNKLYNCKIYEYYEIQKIILLLLFVKLKSRFLNRTTSSKNSIIVFVRLKCNKVSWYYYVIRQS